MKRLSVGNAATESKTLQLPQAITNEAENEKVSELQDIKFPTRLRTSNTDCRQHSETSGPRNKKRSKRFEEALVKWQEYGNDIIERKPPNFLELKDKPRKGTWIYATKSKYHDKLESRREANLDKDRLYKKKVEQLAERLSDNLREFQEMHERTAKIELTLKQLKEKAKANLTNENNMKI